LAGNESYAPGEVKGAGYLEKKMNTNLSVDHAWIDPSLKIRSLNGSDAEAVAAVIYAACEAEGDTIAAVSAKELEHEWQAPDFNLETDSFAVETPEGRIVGFAAVINEQGHQVLYMDGNVHPEFKGRGIGTTLLRSVEKRARELIALAEPDVRCTINTTLNRNAPDGIALHQNEGYQPIRYHWRMETVLDGPPPQPNWPEGIQPRAFNRREHEIAVWQAQNDVFRDHPGSQDQDLEEWRRYRFDDPEYDPSLWVVAWDGPSGEVAGFSINRYRMGIGWIRTLGVRRSWRKRGLGEALLMQSFGEYYRRGTQTIGLGVNAHNPTGATRLYQKVGMRPASEHVTYEKELRPGVMWMNEP
jgi:mycothiol synthase